MSRILIEGGGEVSPRELDAAITLRQGQPFNYFAAEEGRAALTQSFTRRGHLYARVEDEETFDENAEPGQEFARVVVRKLSIPLLLALFFAPNAFAQGSTSSLLMPGVTYTKRVQFTPHGPVVLNVITAPKPGGLYSVQPALSNDSIIGREKLTTLMVTHSMQQAANLGDRLIMMHRGSIVHDLRGAEKRRLRAVPASSR